MELEQRLPHDQSGLIEPSPQLPHKYSVQGASALVTATSGGDVPFRLLNPTSKPIRIYKGTTLGAFTSMHGIASVQDTLSPVPDITDNSKPDRSTHVDLAQSTLTPSQWEVLLALLQQYRDVFALSPDELGRTDIIKYTIDTGDSPPIRLRPYRACTRSKEGIRRRPC